MAAPVLLKTKTGALRAADLLAALRKLGVAPGQLLVVHSSLFKLGRPGSFTDKSAFAAAFIEVLREAVGPQGTLAFPTFTFSFCTSHVFDPHNTPGETGLLGEAARTMPGFVRTHHPIYSYAVQGPLKDELLEADTTTCFGPGSVFDRMLTLDRDYEPGVHFLVLGAEQPPNFITFVHFLEQRFGVPYRTLIHFEGTLVIDGKRRAIRTDFFARLLENPVRFAPEACWREWQARGVGCSASPTDTPIALVRAGEAHDATMAALGENVTALCADGWKPAAAEPQEKS